MGRRARLALVACTLWLAGFEILPWLHVALHDELAPHVHAADGTIVRVSFDEPTHVHADGTIHYAHSLDRRDAPDAAPHPHRHRLPAGTSYALDHGAGSLAHHGVVVIPAPPPPFVPLPATPIATLVIAAPCARPGSLSPLHARARGPPVGVV